MVRNGRICTANTKWKPLGNNRVYVGSNPSLTTISFKQVKKYYFDWNMPLVFHVIIIVLYVASVIECYQIFKRQENITTNEGHVLYLTISLLSGWVALPIYYLLKHYFSKKEK